MRSIEGVETHDVANFYDGEGGSIIELAMGEQAHVGGLDATLELAEAADISAGQRGVDLCCCNGGGMRALIRFRGVASMIGVDISEAMLRRGEVLSHAEGLASEVEFILGDACNTGLPPREADFVWSEDAWIYVPDKASIVAEAVRLVRPGGRIAFSDWVEGPAGLAESEAALLLRTMRFPSIETLGGYRELLEGEGCDVTVAEQTGRFGASMADYAGVLSGPRKYEALRVLDFDEDALAVVVEGFRWLSELGEAGKLAQVRLVATVE